MSRPEDALTAARRAAARRAAEDGPESTPITRFGPAHEEIRARLSEWAVPDPSGYTVGSIRRYGAPITWGKRLLVRLLAQYHGQLLSDQARFNVLILGYVRSLEERVQLLEEQLAGPTGDEEEPDALEDDWA